MVNVTNHIIVHSYGSKINRLKEKAFRIFCCWNQRLCVAPAFTKWLLFLLSGCHDENKSALCWVYATALLMHFNVCRGFWLLLINNVATVFGRNLLPNRKCASSSKTIEKTQNVIYFSNAKKTLRNLLKKQGLWKIKVCKVFESGSAVLRHQWPANNLLQR